MLFVEGSAGKDPGGSETGTGTSGDASVFVGNGKIAQLLKSSTAFGSCIKVGPVTDPNKLTRGYLAKERTSQAGYGPAHCLVVPAQPLYDVSH